MIDDEKGGRKINPIVLRTYELDRLRYYFAVIQFSTKFVAEKIYQSFDSQEIEETACVLDLRFIPDDLEFPRKPTDSCFGIEDAIQRKLPHFKTSALGSTDLRLTWDTNIQQEDNEEEDSSSDERLCEEDLLKLREGLGQKQNNFGDFKKNEDGNGIEISFKVGFDELEEAPEERPQKNRLTKRQFQKLAVEKKIKKKEENKVSRLEQNKLKLLVDSKDQGQKEIDL